MPKSVLGKRKAVPKEKQVKKLKIQRPLMLTRSNELKFNDTTLANTAITSTGVILHSSVCCPQLGTENYQRIGKKINIRSIHMRGNVIQPSQTDLTTMSTNIRVIVYLDKQCNAAALTVGHVLHLTDSDSFRALEFVDRVQVLYDEDYTFSKQAMGVLSGPTYSSPESQCQLKPLNKKVNIPVYFNSTNGGTVADVVSNNIGILVIADVATNAYLDGFFRIRFSDS